MLAEESVKISEHAGELITNIVPSIQETAELVQEIRAASDEQATGVKQVSIAIVSLDKAAQSGASTSEELAVTAEQMSAQAYELRKMISFFKLDEFRSSDVTLTHAPQQETPPLPSKSHYSSLSNSPVNKNDFESF